MAIIKLKKDKNAQHFELKSVQDVKVNGISVFDDEEANIKLKSINNQSIVGEGNIDINKIKELDYQTFVNGHPSQEDLLDIVEKKYELIRIYNIEEVYARYFSLVTVIVFPSGSIRLYYSSFDSIESIVFNIEIVGNQIDGYQYYTNSKDVIYVIETDETLAGDGTSNNPLGINMDDIELVKTTANQNLTNQQKINARNNIGALGTSNVKQSTGNSTTDVISQKGVTDLLADKQSNKPDGTHLLIATDTGKIDLVYIPSTVLGGITNGGTFNGSGVITASSYAPELQGEKIDEVEFGSYPSYYFICSSRYSFAGYDFAVGDWAISLGNGWAKLNATDAVTSVNNKMGQVVLDYDDVGAAKKSWGIDNANKNIVTDAQGNVTTSDYALGQIIVDYYEELPTNVPATAKASVANSSTIEEPMIYENIDYYGVIETLILKEEPIMPTEETGSISFMKFDESEYYTIDISTVLGEIPTFNLYLEDGSIYSYNFEEQESFEGEILNVGWYYFNPETSEATSITYDEVPILENITVDIESGYEVTQNFLNNILIRKTYLSGDYMYTEIQPSTTPKTYYWRYTPTNVQADWGELNPLSLAYIKNKPDLTKARLNTTNTTSLSTNESEEITGTINLHKVSKTGDHNDLNNFVGKRIPKPGVVGSVDGEIFNGYWGTNLNTASGESSHAEGRQTTASGLVSHAEGSGTTASGAYSHAQGYHTTASGTRSHTEGGSTTAAGEASHAEGVSCSSTADYAHSEGYFSYSQGIASHSEGGSTASGDYSHAENISVANADYAHSEGYNTKAGSAYQHVQGKYNLEDTNNDYAHIVGNGVDTNNKSNCHTVDWNGNAWYAGDIRVGGTSYNNATTIIGIPVLPSDASTKTYVLKAINGILQWVEEN